MVMGPTGKRLYVTDNDANARVVVDARHRRHHETRRAKQHFLVRIHTTR